MQSKTNRSVALELYPDEVETFMKKRKEGTYTLLDVRQPMEYEEAHLPGAKLIPLPKLLDSVVGLDPAKPVVIYCAVGGRSRMAAQLLVNQGFKEVYNVVGGIQAWEQPTATGPVEFHLKFVRGDESAEAVVGLAYSMEVGLREFHQKMKDQTTDGALSELLTHLIRAEDGHMKALEELLREVSPESDLDTLISGVTANGPMEGGIDVSSFIQANEPYLQTLAGYLDIAMMIETQALDLYLRMASESRNDRARAVLLRIGDEEKAHLALLARYLDEKGRRALDTPF